MVDTAQSAIKELQKLGTNNVYSMGLIDGWYTKYSDLYNEISVNWVCEYCSLQNPFGCVCTEKADEYLFMELYFEFYLLLSVHKEEPYFKNQLTIYHKVKANRTKLKELIKQNIEPCKGCHTEQHKDLEKDTHLKVNSGDFKKFDILIPYSYFENTIAFIAVFWKLFYEEKIIPEALNN